MKLDGYTIERRLAAGGQATVYLAIQESLSRPVALKILDPLQAQHPASSTRFLNDGRILASLGHSNAMTIHDIGVQGDLHYMAMEYVDGPSLRQQIGAGMDPQTVLRYLVSIADCLAAAHAKQIVHRDIKPANILFRRDGTLLVTDFGIAKQLCEDAQLTHTGATVGSPSYLSPEQALGAEVDGRSDLYSLGAMAFEMLTGQKPYCADSRYGTIHKHLHAPVPTLPEHLGEYQELIDRCMAKSPEERFDDACELLQSLYRLQGKPEKTPVRCGVHGTSTDVGGWSDTTTLLDDTRATTLMSPEGEPCDATRSMATRAVRRGFAAAAFSVAAVSIWASGFMLEASTAREFTAPVDQAASSAVIGRRQASAPAGVSQLMARISRSQREEELLAAAEKALAKLRLSVPANDNALSYFEQALAINPDSPAALEGRPRIVARYVALARSAVSRNRLSKARIYVRRGLAVDHTSSQLLDLKGELGEPTRPNQLVAPSPSPSLSPPPQVSDDAEITGESPAALARRIKSWFE